MESFEIKCLAAGFLWALSICFGIFLPYCLWKISLQKYYFDVPLSEDENMEGEGCRLPQTEPENSTQRKRVGGWRPWSGPVKVCKKGTSCMQVRCSSSNFLSFVNCVCGGVFLGVSLLDLMPQSTKAMSVFLKASDVKTAYPLAEFAVGLGLLIVMIVENIMMELVGPSHRHGNRRHGGPTRECESGTVQDLDDSIAAYRMYVLVATISLHSIFEGLAIGLQKEITTLIQLLIAISVHKSVLTFGVGLRLFEVLGKLEKSCVAILCSLMFCSASPLGCFIGAFIASDRLNSSPGALMATAVLQCLASGTFLYVTFVEVIPREFAHNPREQLEGAEATNYSNSNVGPVFAGQSGIDYGQETADTSSRTSMHRHGKKQSQLLKLLMLILGFSLASGLQFL